MDITTKRDFFQTDDELQRLVDLQNVVYKERGLKFSVAGFKFWYVNNPLGRVYSFNAYDADKMVASYAGVPIDWIIGGEKRRGLLSMAVVTHPDYRGKGLFVKLARQTYECARDEGVEFVIGVANANSIHALTKYLGHKFIANLDVKWGWGDIINTSEDKIAYRFFDKETLDWRLNKPIYSKYDRFVYGKKGYDYGIKTLMGCFDEKLMKEMAVPESRNLCRPLNLYVGLGADLSHGHYFNFPKFVKHSPFNLHILDLTEGKIPELNKDNIFFQLIDFDVA